MRRACDSRLRHRWIGWDERGRSGFRRRRANATVEADATVLALGGASWPRLGSDGSWADCLRRRASRSRRCGRPIAASPSPGPISSATASRASRSRASRFRSATQAIRGEAIVTRTGIEGGAIYALSAAVARGDRAVGRGDAADRAAARSRRGRSCHAAVRAARQAIALQFPAQGANLSPVAIGLLQEAAIASGQIAGVALAGAARAH